jgi:CRP-like cAMP-binding protein
MQGLARAIQDNQSDDPFVTRLGRYTTLSPADLHALRLLIEGQVNVKKRRDLVVDGYAYRKLSFIKEGFAARYKVLRNGKRQILNVLVPGDVVGLPGSFVERAAYSVIALTDMKLNVCALDDFIALCYRRPKFGLALAWLAVHEANIYADHIIDLGRRTSIERLAHFLLEVHSRLATVHRAEALGFDLPFSQEVMSDALGLSVPHLNRMFSQLRTDRLISLTARHVKFTDRKALELLAHFQPLNLSRIPPEVASGRSA